MIQALPGTNPIPHSPHPRLYVLNKKINRTERCSDLTAAASFNASARIGRRPLQSNCRRYQTSGCLLSCLIRTELKTAREPHCNPKSMPGRSGKRRHSPTVSAVIPDTYRSSQMVRFSTLSFQRRLGSCKTRDRHSERRTGDIVQSDLLTELD